MKESIIISILIIIIYIFLISNKTNLLLIETNGNHVLVRDNTPNITNSAELLGNVITRLYVLRDNMVKNKSLYPSYDSYIVLMSNNFNKTRTIIYENSTDSPYTSYSVNKGEEIVFCLRCKVTKELHSLNLLMYVAIHELAHTACPEIGHPPLFNKIFKFLLEHAVSLELYYYENYNKNPVEYCGMKLYTNILN
jgi:hypothetical protein